MANFPCRYALVGIIVAAPFGIAQAPKLEAVSKRMTRQLAHPNPSASLVGGWNNRTFS